MHPSSVQKHVRTIVVGLVAIVCVLTAGCDHSGIDTIDQVDADRGGLADLSNSQQVKIRVLLSRTDRLEVTSRAAPVSFRADDDETVLFELGTEQKCHLLRRAGNWRIWDSQANVLADSAGTSSDTIEIRCGTGGLLGLGHKDPAYYRGEIHCIAQDANTFMAVNVLGVEEYLGGVVGAEMPAYWHKAALRAQSVASRTFALYQASRSGSRPWDVVDTQFSQVYRGVAGESRAVLQAIRQTRGIVLTYGPPGREKIFSSYFCSTCGGHTEDGLAVFRDAPRLLTGRKCPYCQSVAKRKYYRWPSVKITKRTVSDRLIDSYPALAKLGSIAELRIIEQSDYGRVRRVELLGSNGKKATLNGEEFRLSIVSKDHPVRSSWYDLAEAGGAWEFKNGRGWGHAVGMCQCGSEGMAKKGKDCIAILQYYYPNSILLRAY